MKREFKRVEIRNIHQSTILPPREHCPEFFASVKRMGIQQPPIVRPIAGKTGEYEMMDGSGRVEKSSPDAEILVDVRCDVKDSEVFIISNATFARTERSAYETGLFYAAWLKTLEKESGSEGSQQKLAGEAGISESSLSQYLAIAKLFQKLSELAPEEQFPKLKTWSINKLYKLSELVDDSRLLDVARFFDMKCEVSPEEVEETVNNYRGIEQEQELLLFDQDQSSSKADTRSMPTEHSTTSVSQESKTTCLKNAKRVGSLVTETHDILNSLVTELMNGTERFSSSEILQTLTIVLHTLRKLKRHSTILKQKMNLN